MADNEIKKHVNAVHISTKLTLVQRKISNVLLKNAYHELPTQDIHTIRLKDLKEAIGHEKNGYAEIRSIIKMLTRVPIEWSVLDKKNKEKWGISTLLAGAEMEENSSLLKYAYSPFLRKELYNPAMYAIINLTIQQEFKSNYALILYENCIRFKNNGTTGFIELAVLRELFGLSDGTYPAFKDFNRWVLTPAIKGVNAVSKGSGMAIEPDYQRKGRTITHIKFKVKVNKKLLSDDSSIVTSIVDGATVGLLSDRLRNEFKLTIGQINKAIALGDERIISNIAYLENELKSGKNITNISAYLIKAISEDYASNRGIPTQATTPTPKRNSNEATAILKKPHTFGAQFTSEPQQAQEQAQKTQQKTTRLTKTKLLELGIRDFEFMFKGEYGGDAIVKYDHYTKGQRKWMEDNQPERLKEYDAMLEEATTKKKHHQS